eukprot:jgi/Chrzof1/972/Cz01g35100.t1
MAKPAAVVEKRLSSLDYPNLRVINSVVTDVDTDQQLIKLQSGDQVQYDKLCIATGAVPKTIAHHPHVITLRDSESIQEFAARLKHCSRIVVVGNGGIALEIMGAVKDVEMSWVLKQGHIGDAFFDADTAQFLLGLLNSEASGAPAVLQQQHGSCNGQQQQQPPPPQQLEQQQRQQQQEHLLLLTSDTVHRQQPPATEAELATVDQPHPDHQVTGNQQSTLQSLMQSDQQQSDQQQSDQQQSDQQQSTGHTHKTTSGTAVGGSSLCSQHHQPVTMTRTGHAAGPNWTHGLPAGGTPARITIEANALVAGVYSSYQEAVMATGAPDSTPATDTADSDNAWLDDQPSIGDEVAGAMDTMHDHGPPQQQQQAPDWPVYVKLTNGKVLGADLVVSATGVLPNTGWLSGA